MLLSLFCICISLAAAVLATLHALRPDLFLLIASADLVTLELLYAGSFAIVGALLTGQLLTCRSRSTGCSGQTVSDELSSREVLDLGREAEQPSNEHMFRAIAQHSATYVLSTLQKKGRLIDFAMEAISGRSDAEVGQVARVVHQGIREALTDMCAVRPVHTGSEGELIRLSHETDFRRYHILGKGSLRGAGAMLSGTGIVLHPGWETAEYALPDFSYSQMENDQQKTEVYVLQPAEVELQATGTDGK